MMLSLTDAFVLEFGYAPSATYQAPGRVNLIGEHTDYNQGFVLPCAINFATQIAIKPRQDHQFVAVACNYDNQRSRWDLDKAQRSHDAPWSDYLKGITQVLVKRGYRLNGFDLMVRGDVPLGAGLSSSAALSIAFAYALNDQLQLGLSGLGLAQVAQQAENEFVGCQCGIMDQLISAIGTQSYAALIDCQSLSWQGIPIPAEMELLIVHSNVKRGLVDSEYNLRRQQCEQVARFFGHNSLRGLSIEELNEARSQLDPVMFRRARHVLSENQRVLGLADALVANNPAAISQIMRSSHQSMAEDFEITVPAIDALVSIIHSEIGDTGGVRMTGGGFGGCVVSLLPSDKKQAVVDRVVQEYPKNSGLYATFFNTKASSGACRVR